MCNAEKHQKFSVFRKCEKFFPISNGYAELGLTTQTLLFYYYAAFCREYIYLTFKRLEYLHITERCPVFVIKKKTIYMHIYICIHTIYHFEICVKNI